MSEQLYYPCIMDCLSARIIKRVSIKKMSFDQAEAFLKKHYPNEWRNCDAAPKSVNLAVFVAPPSKSRPAVCG